MMVVVDDHDDRDKEEDVKSSLPLVSPPGLTVPLSSFPGQPKRD